MKYSEAYGHGLVFSERHGFNYDFKPVLLREYDIASVEIIVSFWALQSTLTLELFRRKPVDGARMTVW